MPELPWFKCYPQDCLSDQKLRRCTDATRGVWFFAWLTMKLNATFKLEGTIPELARDCSTTDEGMASALTELEKTGTATVESMQNGCKRLICRRLRRENNIRELRIKAAKSRWGGECKDDAKGYAKAMQPVDANTHARSVSVSASASSEGVGGAGEGGEFITEARVVIHFLNETVGRSFRETATNLATIRERFNEGGVTLEGVKQMIVRQKAAWGDDPKMSEFLRIETLFAKSKFDSYYSAKTLPVIKSNGGSPAPQTVFGKEIAAMMRTIEREEAEAAARP